MFHYVLCDDGVNIKNQSSLLSHCLDLRKLGKGRIYNITSTILKDLHSYCYRQASAFKRTIKQSNSHSVDHGHHYVLIKLDH